MSSLKKNAKQYLEKMVSSAAAEVTSKDLHKLPPQALKKIREQLDTNQRTVQSVPIKLIKIDENIRQRYSSEGLEKLANSLKKDGLIQFPTLCLAKSTSGYHLVCRNGHRRILAAKLLEWSKIDCSITSIESARDEVYLSINANLSENVFYLDLAKAYQTASSLGEKDQEIAERVGVNARTIGWYRRLSNLTADCEKIIRDNPKIFNATWAINLARKGELPPGKTLKQWLGKMLEEGRAWTEPPAERRQGATAFDSAAANKTRFRSWISGASRQKVLWADELVDLLLESGMLQKRQHATIKEYFQNSSKKRSKGKPSSKSR